MFNLINRNLLHSRNGSTFRTCNSSMAVPLSLIRYLSSVCVSESDNKHSFTVNYLINSCGLSPKSALMASKVVQFKNRDKPDLILSFFEKHGFSKPQIADIIGKQPKFLSAHPLKLFPKVEFLRSKGASTSDIVRIFTHCPIHRKSLENKLVPALNCLAQLLQSEEHAIEVIKRFPRVISYSFERYLIPNVKCLTEYGCSAANISFMIRHHLTNISTINSVSFRETVVEIKEMGFDPLKHQFVAAIAVYAGRTKATRDKKVEVYKSWGWSDKDVTAAFKKYPWYMALSEDKIMAAMEFYVNKMGMEPSAIASSPVLLGFSLKRRLIPRGAVIQFLRSKNLLESDSRITPLFNLSEECFIEKYVKSHPEEAPLLMNLYNEMLNEAVDKEKRE